MIDIVARGYGSDYRHTEENQDVTDLEAVPALSVSLLLLIFPKLKSVSGEEEAVTFWMHSSFHE